MEREPPNNSAPFSEETTGPNHLARLRLVRAVPLDCGRLCALTADSDTRPPFSQRRGRVKSATIEIEETELARILSSEISTLTALLPASLPAPDKLAARFLVENEKPLCFLLARFSIADREPLWCSLRLPLGPGRRDLRGPRRSTDSLALSLSLSDADVRVYGSSAVPQPLLGLSAAICLSAAFLCFRRASAGPVVLRSQDFMWAPGLRLLFAHGLREVCVDVLADALLQVMPCHGYRAADAQTATLATVEVHNGILRLTFDGLAQGFEYDDDPRGRPTVDGGQIESLLLADRLLVEGDGPAALAAYSIVSSVPTFSDLAILRTAQVVATSPTRIRESLADLEALIPERPWDVGLQLLVFSLRPPDDQTAALIELSKTDTQTVEEQALLLLWAAEKALDCVGAVDLSSQAFELLQNGDCPTVALVAAEAAARVEWFSARLSTEAGERPPAPETDSHATPLIYGERCFLSGDLRGAEENYRRALFLKAVSATERPHIHLRLAEIAHHDSLFAKEEAELALAIETGGGAAAWSALASLYQSRGDSGRMGVALYAWSLHETGEARADLLRQAAQHVSRDLLAAVDDALLQSDADDEQVRDRLMQRRQQQDDHRGLLALLLRDMHRSAKPRKWESARKAADLAARLGDVAASAEAVLHTLSFCFPAETETFDEDALRAVILLTGEPVVPAETTARLRSQLVLRGSLRGLVRRLDQRIALLSVASGAAASLLPLYRQTALCFELLDEPAAAVLRHLRGAALGDICDETAMRKMVANLVLSSQQKQAQHLLETELRRCPPERSAFHRLALGELHFRVGDIDAAQSQLELALSRDPDLASAHARLGQLLVRHGAPADRPRALQHLLTASEKTALDANERGECALWAAKLLLHDDEQVDFNDQVPSVQNETIPVQTAVLAEDLLHRAMQLCPTDVRMPTLLLRRAIGQKQIETALSLCDRLVKLAQTPTETANALWRKSQVLPDQPKHAAQKVDLLQRALSADPAHLPSLSALRQHAERRGDKNQALSWLCREIEASPSDAERAALLCKQADWLDAREQADLLLATLRKAVSLGFGPAAKKLAAYLFARGELLAAADMAGRAAQLLPVSEQGPQFLLAAEWASQAGDDLRARDCLRRAAELSDESAQEAQQRLLVLNGGQDLTKQRRTLENRLAQGRSSLATIETLRQLVVLCARHNDLAQVERYAQSLLSVAPLDELALTAHADCLLAQGHPADKLFPALRVCPEYPRRVLVLEAKAAWLLSRGEKEAAETTLTEALSLGPSPSGEKRHPLARRLAQLQSQRGDFSAAAATRTAFLDDLHDADERTAERRQIARDWVSADKPLFAIEVLSSLLAEQPGNLAAREQLLEVAEKHGSSSETCLCLDELVAKTDGESRARWLCRRAAWHEKRGERAEVLSDAEAVLTLTCDPDLLRFVVQFAVQVSDGELLRQAYDALQKQKAPLLEMRPLAGCALLLHRRGTGHVSEAAAEQMLFFSSDETLPASQPTRKEGSGPTQAPVAPHIVTPGELAVVVCQAVAPFAGALSELDRLLFPLRRRLGAKLPQFRQCLDECVFSPGVNLGAAKILARMTETERPMLQGLYLSVLAFVDPSGEAARRLDVSPKLRFSSSEEHLPKPGDKLRPMLTFLRHLSRLLQTSVRVTLEPGLAPVSRLRKRQAHLFAWLGGELLNDAHSLRAWISASAALWLPGREPNGPTERAYFQKLQARALASSQPSLTIDQARLLLEPLLSLLKQNPVVFDALLAEGKEFLFRWARLLAALEEPDFRISLASIFPDRTGLDSHAASSRSPSRDTWARDRLALLEQTLPLTFLRDAQILLS